LFPPVLENIMQIGFNNTVWTGGKRNTNQLSIQLFLMIYMFFNIIYIYTLYP
jgi:hypothetical protein